MALRLAEKPVGWQPKLYTIDVVFVCNLPLFCATMFFGKHRENNVYSNKTMGWGCLPVWHGACGQWDG
jgi:hypothetical protein